ncbi:hypothetical protein EPNKCIFM_00081 [Klebsiella phage KP13-16]|nr:hypothetical protein EPNKCIFM_00081 [Klebsiella phage KP13-16]
MANSVDHIQYNPDYVKDTFDLLLEQFKGSDNLVKLLQVIASMKKQIDDEVIFLGKHRTIDTGTGIVLDNIGEELGVPRNGASDDDYRNILKIRSYRTKTSGTMPEIIDLLVRFTGVDAQSINIYIGSQKSFDIAFYEGCLNAEKAEEELTEIFPILSSYRLLLKSGTPLGFGSVYDDTPSDVFQGFGSVFDENSYGGHLPSLLTATP